MLAQSSFVERYFAEINKGIFGKTLLLGYIIYSSGRWILGHDLSLGFFEWSCLALIFLFVLSNHFWRAPTIICGVAVLIPLAWEAMVLSTPEGKPILLGPLEMGYLDAIRTLGVLGWLADAIFVALFAEWFFFVTRGGLLGRLFFVGCGALVFFADPPLSYIGFAGAVLWAMLHVPPPRPPRY